MGDSFEGIIHILKLSCIALVVLVFHLVGYLNGYKSGQIDALTGVIKYELVTNTNKTSEWRRIRTNAN